MSEPKATTVVTRDIAWNCTVFCDREGFCATRPVPDTQLSASLSTEATPETIRAHFEKAAEKLVAKVATDYRCSKGISFWVKPTAQELAALAKTIAGARLRAAEKATRSLDETPKRTIIGGRWQ